MWPLPVYWTSEIPNRMPNSSTLEGLVCKTCAIYHDKHVPESSVEILGHSVSGITYRHSAHRAPLAFRAIMTLPQPTASSALLKGCDGECPCCRRRFADAA